MVSSESANLILYEFNLSGGTKERVVFEIDISPEKVIEPPEAIPEWAQLGFNKCRVCTLNSSDCAHCSMALSVEQVVAAFGKNISTERVEVTVTTQQRTFKRECDLQTGIGSLLGLLMANSRCEVMKPLRMLVNFHIPFCNTQELLRRIVGAYLTQQYYNFKNGLETDWEMEKLKSLFEKLATLNQDFVKRIQGTLEKDAVSNAILGFFASSSMMAADFEAIMLKNESYMLNGVR